MAKRAVPVRSDGPQHRLTEKREEFTTDLGQERTGRDRRPVRRSLFKLFAIRRVEDHLFRTQDADKLENQAEGDAHDSRQRHPFQLGGANVHFSAANADDQDHGGEDQILRFTVIHLRFNQYADPRGADHPVQQQGNAAHHRHRDDLDSRRQFADAGEQNRNDRRAADYQCCRPG